VHRPATLSGVFGLFFPPLPLSSPHRIFFGLISFARWRPIRLGWISPSASFLLSSFFFLFFSGPFFFSSSWIGRRFERHETSPRKGPPSLLLSTPSQFFSFPPLFFKFPVFAGHYDLTQLNPVRFYAPLPFSFPLSSLSPRNLFFTLPFGMRWVWVPTLCRFTRWFLICGFHFLPFFFRVF